MEVSEAGVVTAKNEGIAKVTAKVGISTQSLFFIVTNQKPRVDQGFEEEETTVRDCFSANKPAIKFLDTYEFVTSPVHSGASALQAKTIVDANLTGGQRAKLNVISVPGFADPEPGSTEETGPAYRSRGVMELWFYDDMNPLKNNALEIFSQKGGDGNYDGDTFPTGVAVNPNKDCWANALRGYLNLGGTQYSFAPMGAETTQYYGPYIVNPIDRTMGWHQIIIDYTQNEAYTIYIDGQLMMTRSTPGFNSNGGIYPGMALPRLPGRKTMSPLLTTSVCIK